MYFDSSRSVVFSDNLEELISRLIPGYYRLAAESKEEARKSYIKGVFATLQTLLLQGKEISEIEWNDALRIKDSLSEESQTSMLPLLLVSRSPLEDHELTLVYGDELEFLISLDKVGHISLFRK